MICTISRDVNAVYGLLMRLEHGLGGEVMLKRAKGKQRFVVWHEIKSENGRIRHPVGIVEDYDRRSAQIKVMWTLFVKEKGLVLIPTGRHKWFLTPVESEPKSVVKAARALRRF